MDRRLLNVAVYAFVRIGGQGIVFISTLLLAGLVPLEAFAVIGSAMLVQALMVPVAGLGLQYGLERHYFAFEGQARSDKIWTISVAYLALTSLIAAAFYLVFAYLLPLGFLTQSQLAVTLVATILQSAQYVPTIVMRSEERARTFITLQFAFVLITQASIVGATWLTRSEEGWFVGTIVGNAISFAMWGIWTLRTTVSRRLVTIGPELRYSLSVLPVLALDAIQQTVDRQILQSLATAPAFASYALAQRLAAPIATLGATAKTAINPTLFRTQDLDNAKRFLERITGLSIAALGVGVCLMSGMVGLIVTKVLGDSYLAVFPLFLGMCAGFFLRAQEYLLNVGPDVVLRQGDRTKLLVVVILVQTAIMASLTVALGVIGAVIAFVINGALRTMSTAVQGHRHLPRKFPTALYAATNIAVLLVLVLWYFLFR